MQHLQEPQVVITFPGSLARDIATNTKVTIRFNVDLHARHIADTVIVRCLETTIMDARLEDPGVAAQSTVVSGIITYGDRALVFTPDYELKPNMVYSVMVISNAAAQQGVRSALGRFMPKNYVFNFMTAQRTALKPVQLISPAHNAVINTAPTFNWRMSTSARYYNVEVSRSNTFRTIHWSNYVDSSVIEPPLKPIEHFAENLFDEDGIYYWRVQAVSWHDDASDYSAVYQFNIDRSKVSTIHPTDSLPLDPALPEQPILSTATELLSTFPEHNFSNVATNLNSISFKLAGDFDVTQLRRSNFQVVGETTSGDGLSHGEVIGVYTIIKIHDGSTLIAFTPDALQND